MMIIRSYPPKEFHRGLYVTYYNDWKDCYMSTDFKLVLDEPSAPIDPAVMQTCIGLFSFLLTGEVGEKEYYSGGPNTVTFSYMHHFHKADALEWAVKLCRRFLDKDSIDPAALAGLLQYDKAAEIVRTFLADVTENGKYEYEEDIN